MYHGLARRHLTPPRFLMRPLLNGGTLGGRRMTQLEAYEPWLPFPDAAQLVSIEGVVDCGDVPFRVLIRQRHAPVVYRLQWDSRPHAYRNIDEGYRLQLWRRFTPGTNPFWIVRHSNWLEEFRREAGGVCDDLALSHYAIYTDDDCLDILSTFPPTCALAVGSER
jgi:hypothetical protein